MAKNPYCISLSFNPYDSPLFCQRGRTYLNNCTSWLQFYLHTKEVQTTLKYLGWHQERRQERKGAEKAHVWGRAWAGDGARAVKAAPDACTISGGRARWAGGIKSPGSLRWGHFVTDPSAKHPVTGEKSFKRKFCNDDNHHHKIRPSIRWTLSTPWFSWVCLSGP